MALPPLPISASDATTLVGPTENDATDDDTIALLSIDEAKTMTGDITVDNSFVSLPGFEFEAQKKSDNEWAVIVSSTRGSDSSLESTLHQSPLASIRRGPGGLRFAWDKTAAGRADYAFQLSNAVFVIGFPSGKQAICPRKLVEWAAAPIDLSKTVLRVNLPIKPLLPFESLHLEIDRVESPAPRFYPSSLSRTAEDSQRAMMKREDPVSSTIDVRLVQKNETLVLEFRAYYSGPGGARRPMVAKEMISSANKRAKLLEQAKATTKQASAAIPGLQSRLREAQGRRSDDPREKGNIIRAAQAAESNLNKAIRARDRANRAIPEIESGLKELKQAIELAKGLHKNAKVHLKIVANSTEYAVPILLCGSPGE